MKRALAAALGAAVATGAGATGQSPLQPLDLVPRNSSLILTANPPQVEQLLNTLVAEVGQDSDQVRQLAQGSSLIVAGVRPVPGREFPFITVLADGCYPHGLVQFQLFFSPEWSYQTLSLRNRQTQYWKSTTGSTELSTPHRNLFLVSNGDMATALTRQDEQEGDPLMPAGLTEQLPRSAFSAWIPDPRRLAAESGNSGLQRFPLRESWIVGFLAADGVTYVLETRITLAAQRQAALFAVVARAAVALILRQLRVPDPVARLQEVTVKVDGTAVAISGLRLGPEELLTATRLLIGEQPFAEAGLPGDRPQVARL